MIKGRTDTWYTVDEFAAMVGREPKTIHNWAADGRLQFAYLFSVPFVSLTMVEALIAGQVTEAAPAANAALRVISRRDHDGRRTSPERHRRQRRMTGESAACSVLHSSKAPVGSSPP